MRINGRRLEKNEFTDFEESLRDVFNLKEFKAMLRKRLNWPVLDRDADDGFFTEMIDKAENDEKTQELLEAALKEKSDSSLLKAFAERIGYSPLVQLPTNTSAPPRANPPAQQSTEPSERHLERQVSALHSSLDPAPWRALMEKRERQICRIVIQGWDKAYGTGFLVGADVVMTNYHILKDVIDGEIPSSRVSLYFDYKLKEDGTALETGSKHQVADDWLLDHSEHSDLDRQNTEQCDDVDERYLDYALLRLKKEAGEEHVGGVKRGWIDILELEYGFQPGTALLILHHPGGGPLTFDLDTRSIIEVNTNKTRVRYTTNTKNGSSGAPCFTANWELVAIHQSGDPDFTHSAKYNQGIPIATILRRLKKHGKDKYLSLWSGAREKNGNGALSAIGASLAQFEMPESMMSEEGQQHLALLLGREGLITFDPSSSIPINVTREILEHIDSKHLFHHLYLLLKEYNQIISSLVEKARAPFAGSADLLPIHIRNASEQLDLVENCLRKICILLRCTIPFLDSSMVNQITVGADTIIEEKEKFCRLLSEEKRKYDINNSNSAKRNIKNKFADFVKKLNEFLQTLPES
jgi:Trypsin-like peptidase domain